MLALQKRLDALCRELEAERVENAKLRRTLEDVLYNLEEDNMPAVAARLTRGEKSIGLLVEDGEVRGRVLVEAINGASGVTIEADKIDLGGTLIVERINRTSAVAINADKINMGGALIVEKINGEGAVQIKADRIDLNGAVTANENFCIHEDGSASCKALSVTGGSISLPDPGDGRAVLAVHTADEAGGVTVYADHIAFAGRFIPGWDQQASMSLSGLSLTNEVEQADGSVSRMGGHYRPGEIALSWQTNDSPADELEITPRYIRMPFLSTHPVAKTSGMRPVYIGEDGRLHAVLE